MESSRTKNFSSEEIEMLLSLVKEHLEVLENKTTDKIKPIEKEKAWTKIEDKFNAMCPGEKRTSRVLRTKYCNLKASMRRRAADEKRSLYGTGGGPQMKKEHNAEEERFDKFFHEILPGDQIQGRKSLYDSDLLNVNDCLEAEEFDEIRVPLNEQEKILHQDEVRLNVNSSRDESNILQQGQKEVDNEKTYELWETYTPHQLKSRKSRKLRTTNIQKTNQTSWAKLAETKEKWTEIKLNQEVEFERIEHELRVKHMNEKHELEMRILRKKLDE